MSSCPVLMSVFIAVQTEVTIFLIPFNAASITVAAAFHVVVMTFLMLSSAFSTTETMAFHPPVMPFLICDMVASIAVFAFAQTFFTVSKTCSMKPCTAVTTLDRAFLITVLIVSARFPAKPLTASPTTPAFWLIPSASPCMKSGIQLSKSARGPSSGTEKCRKDLILSATPLTASATLPIQFLMPLTMLLMISAPH